MSEKRFTVESTMVRECILDNKTGEQLDTFDYTERLCELLNEQQDTIEQLTSELNDCEKFRYTVFKRLNDEYIKERSL